MSVTAPAGFIAAGGPIGIKPGGRPDCAVVATADGRAVPTAGVFTSNLAAGAPVQVSRAHLEHSSAMAGIVLTSGNANAATGEAGRYSARALCAALGRRLGVDAGKVLVAQTGLIGIPFPLEVALEGIPAVLATLDGGEAAGEAAARAIMTTDTKMKTALVRDARGSTGFTVGAMAKGAAMLAPNMATMLAVLTTDAAVDATTLHRLLSRAVGSSFNSLSVDGCTSTNDTVVVMASGEAGPVPEGKLGEALHEVCASLADQMADDAEGATKVASIVVRGAFSDADAHRAARRVAESLLVKCSLNGEDPYWGRVVSELGSAGVPFDMDRVSIAYGGVVVARDGIVVPHDQQAVRRHMSNRHIEISADLGIGSGVGVATATDLSYGYIDENRTTS